MYLSFIFFVISLCNGDMAIDVNMTMVNFDYNSANGMRGNDSTNNVGRHFGEKVHIHVNETRNDITKHIRHQESVQDLRDVLSQADRIGSEKHNREQDFSGHKEKDVSSPYQSILIDDSTKPVKCNITNLKENIRKDCKSEFNALNTTFVYHDECNKSIHNETIFNQVVCNEINLTKRKSKKKLLYIGGLFDLSGSRSGALGKSELTAAKLAIDHINSKNVLKGYNLKLIFNDTGVSGMFYKFNNVVVF